MSARSLDQETAAVALTQARLRLEAVERSLSARLGDPSERRMMAMVDVVRPMLVVLEYAMSGVLGAAMLCFVAGCGGDVDGTGEPSALQAASLDSATTDAGDAGDVEDAGDAGDAVQVEARPTVVVLGGICLPYSSVSNALCTPLDCQGVTPDDAGSCYGWLVPSLSTFRSCVHESDCPPKGYACGFCVAP